jgi:hypothetical protein
MPYKDKAKQLECQRNWIAARRARYESERGGCCQKCKSAVNLEFHHRVREEKISNRIWGWRKERIEAELAKCDLLCRDCHFLETAKEREYYTAPHGTLTSYQNYKCRCKDCRRANAEYEHNRRLRIMDV